MIRFLPFLFLFLCAVDSRSGEAPTPGSATRSAILGKVNDEFLRVRPCGIEPSSPSGYQVDHLAVEEEWACIAGSARYHGPEGPFSVAFLALLKWKCGCWKVVSISFNAKEVTRQRFLGLHTVPPSILPRWIRWSR